MSSSSALSILIGYRRLLRTTLTTPPKRTIFTFSKVKAMCHAKKFEYLGFRANPKIDDSTFFGKFIVILTLRLCFHHLFHHHLA